jgi:hypothetical protein
VGDCGRIYPMVRGVPWGIDSRATGASYTVRNRMLLTAIFPFTALLAVLQSFQPHQKLHFLQQY